MLVSRLTLLTTLVSVAFPLPDGPGRPERRGWPNWPDWRPNWPGWPNRDDEFDLVGYGRDNPLGRTTGGEGGCTTTVTSPEALAIAVGGDEPKIVYDNGKFALPERLKVGSNKTILGVGRRTLITENDISVVNATNVIIRNLKISRIRDNDALTIHSSTRVWIDHNEIESDMDHGPDYYDGQCDIVRGSDWITVSWNYFHDHWKVYHNPPGNLSVRSLYLLALSVLPRRNSDALRDVDSGHLHITYHHNYWRHSGTRGPAGRFGHQHVYNNLYVDFLYQAIHSRSDNQMLVEGNVFRGNTREALSTYGLVIPEDSPNTSPDGDPELDGFANLGARNDWGPASINITQVGNFTHVPYKYKLTPLHKVKREVKAGAGVGKVKC